MRATSERVEERSDDPIQDAVTRWTSEVLEPHLQEHPELVAEFRTGSGEMTVSTIYTPTGDDPDYMSKIGLPGEYPFTRGRLPSGHRSFPWKLGFYSGFGDAASANQRVRQLAEAGAGYVALALDLPSQCGYDPDHPLADGEVGRVGVSISSLRDVEAVLDGVPLERVGTGTVGNCIEPIMAGMFSLVAQKRGIDPGSVHITLQNDPLKEYTGRGTYIVPIEPAVELAADVAEHSIRHWPNWIPQYACTTQLRWGGVNASEEIAFGIANLFEYIDRLVQRGIEPGEALVRSEGLHMTVDNDFFEEVAKLRATRRLWARLARERYASSDPRLLGLKLTIFTGAHRLTAQQPLNNITRTAVHVLAALVGGVERISTPAYDEALALPTEESTTVANLTKLILLQENGIRNTVDPLAGSYFVEHLTDRLEEHAEAVYLEVAGMGGAIAAIESGYYESAMLRGLRSQQAEVENGDRVVVGVNAYRRDEPDHMELFGIDERYQIWQQQRVADLKTSRDGDATERALHELHAVLERKNGGERVNSIPAFTAAAASLATMGEMCDVMRAVYGDYQADFSARLR